MWNDGRAAEAATARAVSAGKGRPSPAPKARNRVPLVLVELITATRCDTFNSVRCYFLRNRHWT